MATSLSFPILCFLPVLILTNILKSFLLSDFILPMPSSPPWFTVHCQVLWHCSDPPDLLLYLMNSYSSFKSKGQGFSKWSPIESGCLLLLLLIQFSCVWLCATPIDSSPSGSAIPGILQARTLERVAISFSIVWKWKVKMKSFSCVRLVATPWTEAYQAPPSMGFSRQEYWSGLPLPSPQDAWVPANLYYICSPGYPNANYV